MSLGNANNRFTLKLHRTSRYWNGSTSTISDRTAVSTIKLINLVMLLEMPNAHAQLRYSYQDQLVAH